MRRANNDSTFLPSWSSWSFMERRGDRVLVTTIKESAGLVLALLVVGCGTRNLRGEGLGAAPLSDTFIQPSQARPLFDDSEAGRLSIQEPSSDEPPDRESSSNESLLPQKCQRRSIAVNEDSLEKHHLCLPPEEFAIATCGGHYPGMAVVLFEKSTPWTRLYFNPEASWGGHAHNDSARDTPLYQDEEVLVLRQEEPKYVGMLQISDGSQLEVLRWDGTCVTVERELLVRNRASRARSARVVWAQLDSRLQSALLVGESIQRAHSVVMRACGESQLVAAASKCRNANGGLHDAIFEYVRAGVRLPTPLLLPVWGHEEEGRVALEHSRR